MSKHDKKEKKKKKIGNETVTPPNNSTDSSNNINDKLVTIEIQKEYDVFKGSWEDRIFVKLFIGARTSGLLKNISNRDWKTLCTLATFMDKEGNCYPSQRAIAKALGVCRQIANERIQSLLKFRFKNQPILLMEKTRRSTLEGGRWSNNQYKILPISNLKIFGGLEKTPVSGKHDIGPVSGFPDTGKHDTNYNHLLNKNLNNVKRNAVFHNLKKKERSPEKENLASYIAEQLEDDNSLGFFRKIVDLVPEYIIQDTLGRVKEKFLAGEIKKSKGALFNKIIQEEAILNNIKLELKI